jgi:hypothetical protein
MSWRTVLFPERVIWPSLTSGDTSSDTPQLAVFRPSTVVSPRALVDVRVTAPLGATGAINRYGENNLANELNHGSLSGFGGDTRLLSDYFECGSSSRSRFSE